VWPQACPSIDTVCDGTWQAMFLFGLQLWRCFSEAVLLESMLFLHMLWLWGGCCSLSRSTGDVLSKQKNLESSLESVGLSGPPEA